MIAGILEEGVQRSGDSGVLEDRHPNLDPWFYRASTEPSDIQVLPERSGEKHRGTRFIQRVQVEDRNAWLKFDDKYSRVPRCDGARDKIAADLAQIMKVRIPAVLLWKDGAESGCIQKEPPYTVHHTLKQFLASYEEASLAEQQEVMDILAGAYDPKNVLFDVWVCNTDRATNYKNVLVAEDNAKLDIWVIDYNNALGHLERPWSERHMRDSGLDKENAPILHLLRSQPKFMERLKAEIECVDDRLESADDVTIDEICSRAFAFYDEQCGDDIVSKCLKARKSKVKLWVQELLTS